MVSGSGSVRRKPRRPSRNDRLARRKQEEDPSDGLTLDDHLQHLADVAREVDLEVGVLVGDRRVQAVAARVDVAAVVSGHRERRTYDGRRRCRYEPNASRADRH